MRARDRMRRILIVSGLLFALAASQGCLYAKYRAQDFLDCADLGVTVSIKPGFALYADAVSVACGGLSWVDGWLVGIGGGRIGLVRHWEKCWGLLVIGHEVHAWGDFDKDDTATYSRQFVGALGVPVFPLIQSRPTYMPACIHYLHLGFVGAAANLRYMEMVDFILGWTTLDLACDDGEPIGRWPWRFDY